MKLHYFIQHLWFHFFYVFFLHVIELLEYYLILIPNVDECVKHSSKDE